MKPFTGTEIKVTILILLMIFVATFKNLKISERRSRDYQRRDDLASVYKALHAFQGDFGFFPPSEDGKIKACKGERFDEAVRNAKTITELNKKDIYLSNLRACEWTKDGLKDLFDDNYPAYLTTLPGDTLWAKGASFYYVSNTRYFQIYAHLEGGSSEVGYSSKIEERNLPCGNKICNFGRSAYGKTPLDMTIEEFEQELKEHPELDKVLENQRVN